MELTEIKKITPDAEAVGSDGTVLSENPIPKINTQETDVRDRSFSIKGFFEKLVPKGKTLKIALIVVSVLLILIALPSFLVYRSARGFLAEAMNFREVAKSQNLVAMKEGLVKLKKSQVNLSRSYKLVSWMRLIPFLGGYVADGGHLIKAAGYGLEAGEIVLAVAEPYADILGFTSADPSVLGESAGNGEKTTQERIDFIVKTIPDLIPQIDSIAGKVSLANTEIAKVNPARYPEKVRGQAVRRILAEAISLSNDAARLVKGLKPMLEEADYLLGLDSARTYLVLFQNDKELRPTGGFMSAYSIMKVEDARFEPVISSDIYNLDNAYTPTTPAPEPIIKYLKGPYLTNKNLQLRDMNWSPDFATSMELFSKEAEDAGIENIDGIISVDTQLLVYLLDAIGEIGVSGFGNFSTKIIPECNCPQVIYELESFADIEGPVVWDPAGTGKIIYAPPNYDNRKKIIGPLMNSILANALGQPKEKLPNLFEAGFKSLLEKHILFYLFDDKAQEAVRAFDVAGEIEEYQGDYLHINDANLGGRKSNLYVTEEVEQDIDISSNGSVTKTLTITYKNPEKQDGWLNSVLPNWVRVYVPKGSELIDVSGLEEKVDPYNEFEKTVFAGYFELRPEGVAKVTITYKLPQKVKSVYNMLIQKQPGKGTPLYTIRVNKRQDEFFLKTDKELKLHI